MTKPKKVKKVTADAAFTEGVQEESFLGWVTSKLDAMFVDNIPLDAIRELPERYMYVAGLIAHVAAAACLLYFVLTGYWVATKKEFISVNSDDGICESVSRENGGNYLVTDTGYWEGTDGFIPALTIYRMKFFSFAMTQDEYKSLMQDFKSEIKGIAAQAAQRDAAFNLLYWMTWEMDSPNYLFELTGSSLDVFDRYYTIGYMATVEGVCDVANSATYNGANHRLRLEHSIEDFRNSSLCMSAGHPVHLGYNPNYDFGTFRIDLDINSCLIAIAVTLGVLHTHDLTMIPGTEEAIVTDAGTGYIHQYFDDRYGNMIPVYCFEVNEGENEHKEACVIKIDEAYALPIMNHFGEYDFDSADFPKKCDCSKVDDDSYCHTFDFIIGVIFYDTTSVYPLLELISTYGVERINSLSYTISADAIEGTLTKEQRIEAYEFCDLSFGPCNVIMFNTFDDLTRSVSGYHYQVPRPACTDSFDISDDAWYRIENIPPVELVEKYYSCTQKPADAMFNAIGVATGNTAIMVPILCILCLPILYSYLQLSGQVPPKEEYTKNELDAAEKALALIILRIRDGKRRGVKNGSVLTKLTGDLVSAAKAEGGYADSDDDSDSDDEERAKPTRRRKSSVRGAYIPSSVFMRRKEITVEDDSAHLIVLNNEFGRPSISISADDYAAVIDDMIDDMRRISSREDTNYSAAMARIGSLASIQVEAVSDLVERSQLCVKIYNLLLLHVRLEYDCSMSEAVDRYSHLAAYNIGGQIYSGSRLLRLKNEES